MFWCLKLPKVPTKSRYMQINRGYKNIPAPWWRRRYILDSSARHSWFPRPLSRRGIDRPGWLRVEALSITIRANWSAQFERIGASPGWLPAATTAPSPRDRPHRTGPIFLSLSGPRPFSILPQHCANPPYRCCRSKQRRFACTGHRAPARLIRHDVTRYVNMEILVGGRQGWNSRSSSFPFRNRIGRWFWTWNKKMKLSETWCIHLDCYCYDVSDLGTS